MAIDISGVVRRTRIAVGSKAESIFGNAVEDFTRGVLSRGSTGDPTQAEQNTRRNRPPGEWVSSSYAAHLSGASSYRPKLKFLFKIEFIFKSGVIEGLLNAGLITAEAAKQLRENQFTFMVKTVDRPKVDFEYEDDVNMYNFRTKVLKKIRHRELTVTFLDDTGNRVFNFFRVMMMIHSPITRRQVTRDNTTNLPTSASASIGSGMNFTESAFNKFDIAHRGVVNLNSVASNVGTPFEAIRVKQMFVDVSQSSLRDAPRQVTFDFINPRVVSFDLDDMSHETSEPNLLTMQFDYDWMEMVDNGVQITSDGPDYSGIKAKGITGAPSDTMGGGKENQLPKPIATPGLGDILGNAAARQLGNEVKRITSETVSRAVRSIGGGGRFATTIGNRIGNIVGGAAGSQASSAIERGIGGALGAVSSNSTATGIADSIKGAFRLDLIGQSGAQGSARSRAVGAFDSVLQSAANVRITQTAPTPATPIRDDGGE
jgi:hypothetical protein